MRKTRFLIIACLCASAAVAAQTQAPKPKPAAGPTAGAKPAAKTPSTAAKPAPKLGQFETALLHPDTLTAKAPDMFDVKFTTTAGEFTVHVTRTWAPRGADRFYNLARHHFFDGAAFFRVIPGFMAQFGLSAYPEVNRAWREANLKDDPVTQSNKRGYLTFATAGPNTRTTQMFISFGNNSALDSMGFAPFAQVTDGMDVVDKLYGGYGEGAPDGNGPDQNLVGNRGHSYLEQKFPKLDIIKTATLITAPAAAPVPAAAPSK